MAQYYLFVPTVFRRIWVVFIVMSLGSSPGSNVVASLSKTPEASSTLLKMHRLYTIQPPHDTSLYDKLRVSPNATSADIARAYRLRSRELHPDKRILGEVGGDDSDDEYDNDEFEEELEEVREAYEVLKDDQTRLPYHRFGFIDSSTAAVLLTGGRSGEFGVSVEQRQLMRLMGYGPEYSAPSKHQQRVAFLAANLVETLRPLVEASVHKHQFAHDIAREMDTLKKLPLGAHILRCVGRAYRHAGKRLLKQSRRQNHIIALPSIALQIKDRFRNAKYLLTAAVATGKLVLTEQATKYKHTKSSTDKHDKASTPSIGYHLHDPTHHDELLSDADILDPHVLPSDERIRRLEHSKAQSAVIHTLQIEALWKITKIELDKTIQEACDVILNGDYFFFPGYYSSPDKLPKIHGEDGWVGSTGEVIDVSLGRMRAAAAMVLLGDILVRCSKEGTSWKE